MYLSLFKRLLRDCLLQPVEADVFQVDKKLKQHGTSYAKELSRTPDMVWKYVRRVGRAPHITLPLFDELQASFNSDKFIDPFTNKPLLNAEAAKQLKELRKHIEKGCLMDDPTSILYFETGIILTKIGVSKSGLYEGLMRYRCIRGTSDLEGGIHSKIVVSLSGFAYGAEMMVSHLDNVCFRHNINSAIKNRAHFPNVGHYNLQLLEFIKVFNI